MGKRIREVMTSHPRTIAPSTNLQDAARLLRDLDVGSLPIVDNEECVGMLTDRDIVVRAIAEGRSPSSVSAGEIASKEPVMVDEDEPLDEAERLMAEYQIRRIPVRDRDGHLVGMLSQADVALVHGAKQAGKLVEQVSR